MTYIVHINQKPGSDVTTVEVEADELRVENNGALYLVINTNSYKQAAFAAGVWNYVEPKK